MLNEAAELRAMPLDRTLWAIIVAALAGLAINCAFVSTGRAKAWDDHVIVWIHDLRSSWLDRILRMITDTGGVGRGDQRRFNMTAPKFSRSHSASLPPTTTGKSS